MKTFHTQLNRHTFYLNPLNSGVFQYGENLRLPLIEMPAYSMNLAMALGQSTKVNLLPKHRKQHFLFSTLNKFVVLVAAVLIPMMLSTSFLRYNDVTQLDRSVNRLNGQWTGLSEQAQEYFGMLEDIEHMREYWTYYDNDRVNSRNQYKILKLISAEVPDNIRITSLVFRSQGEKTGLGGGKRGAHINMVELSGFVDAHAGVADIQLTNFILRLDGLGVFTSVDRENRPASGVQNQLLFVLKLGI